MKNYLLLFLLIVAVNAQQKKVLFDATKAETAGNADWIICASGGSIPRIPTPAQSGIIASTPETYWTGALSSWGIDLVKAGYYVEQLPPSGSITYGDNNNVQDLRNYDVFVVDEPNSPFSASEKTAILNFVKNGGGLFMISDHNQSDRNGDGWDSPKVWNDLMSTNTVQVNPFGCTIDLLSFNDASTNVLSNPADPLVNGSAGTVTNIKISAGTTFTLNTTANPTVKGVIWKTGAQQGSTSVLCGYAQFGQGKVVFVGDSSPADDGTGESGKQLYPGWIGEANGDHRRLHLNGTFWLATKQTTGIDRKDNRTNFSAACYPNPFSSFVTVNYSVARPGTTAIVVYNAAGKEIERTTIADDTQGEHYYTWKAAGNTSGIYFVKVISESGSKTIPALLIK